MPRARQYGFLRLDPEGDDYSDLYMPIEIIQWHENDSLVKVRTPEDKTVEVSAEFVQHALLDHFQGCEDLLALRDFSEPALLHTLRVRFNRRESYTAVGTILISVNPYSYHNYEEIYGDQVMDMYRRASWKQIKDSTSLPPHLYVVAERSMRQGHAMGYATEFEGQDLSLAPPENQAIIISGESGAGKTEATRLIVKYLSWRSKAIGAQRDGRPGRKTSPNPLLGSGAQKLLGKLLVGSPIEERITATTPLLEALGNAKTLKNDNSSRFGKFMRLFMDREDGTLSGCLVEQYLLEVTRVVEQVQGENNFHVLRQVLHTQAASPSGLSPSGLSPSEAPSASSALDALDGALVAQLGLGEPAQFRYLAGGLAGGASASSNGGGASEVAGMTDAAGWNTTLECLAALNLEALEVAAVVRLLMAVLHLGNFEISNPATDWPSDVAKSRETSPVTSPGSSPGGAGLQGAVRSKINDSAVSRAASLLHVNPTELVSVMRYRRIVTPAAANAANRANRTASHRTQAATQSEVTGEDVILSERSAAEAHEVRDAISKAIYARLWQAIIKSLNAYLDLSKTQSQGRSQREDQIFIGLLDFAGFEHFLEHPNGYEQLLINYANEMLQWHFNCFIFEVEMAEYDAEGVDTTEIEFRDNEPCVLLIDHPNGGVVSKLDDSCLQGDRSDSDPSGPSGGLALSLAREKRFVRHLGDTFGGGGGGGASSMRPRPADDLLDEARHFFFRPRHDSDFCFGVRHYAGDVVYDTRDAWANKNNDGLSRDAARLLGEGPRNPYLRKLLSDSAGDASLASAAVGIGTTSPSRNRSGGLFQRSVGRRFSDSLKELVGALHRCYPQFVRCVKPNHVKSPDLFAGYLTFRQLVNSGMVEAIRARQAGFAVRIPHLEFLVKFDCLVPKSRALAAASTAAAVLRGVDYRKLPTSRLAALIRDDASPEAEEGRPSREAAAAEVARRVGLMVGFLGGAMGEVVSFASTRVGRTKVFLKATNAYTLHRIAELTEDKWARKIQRRVLAWLTLSLSQRENARRRYRALLEAANAALAASRRTRPRRRANLAAETSVAGFKRRLDTLGLGPAAVLQSAKLEALLREVNRQLDTMGEHCRRIKKAELGEEREEEARLQRDVDRIQRGRQGYPPWEREGSEAAAGESGSRVWVGSAGKAESSPGTSSDKQGGGGAEGPLSRSDLDSPQHLFKFTRLMERLMGEAESTSRALGEALDERRAFQARVWDLYEKFQLNEAREHVRRQVQPLLDKVIAEAESALGGPFDDIDLEGLAGDVLMDRRIGVLIAHKELGSHERDLLARRRQAGDSALQESNSGEEKRKEETRERDHKKLLEQMELFMGLCESHQSLCGSPPAGLLLRMQRVHAAIDAAETAIDRVASTLSAESPKSSGAETDGHLECLRSIAEASKVVMRELNAVQRLGFQPNQKLNQEPNQKPGQITGQARASQAGAARREASVDESKSDDGLVVIASFDTRELEAKTVARNLASRKSPPGDPAREARQPRKSSHVGLGAAAAAEGRGVLVPQTPEMPRRRENEEKGVASEIARTRRSLEKLEIDKAKLMEALEQGKDVPPAVLMEGRAKGSVVSERMRAFDHSFGPSLPSFGAVNLAAAAKQAAPRSPAVKPASPGKEASSARTSLRALSLGMSAGPRHAFENKGSFKLGQGRSSPRTTRQVFKTPFEYGLPSAKPPGRSPITTGAKTPPSHKPQTPPNPPAPPRSPARAEGRAQGRAEGRAEGTRSVRERASLWQRHTDPPPAPTQTPVQTEKEADASPEVPEVPEVRALSSPHRLQPETPPLSPAAGAASQATPQATPLPSSWQNLGVLRPVTPGVPQYPASAAPSSFEDRLAQKEERRQRLDELAEARARAQSLESDDAQPEGSEGRRDGPETPELSPASDGESDEG